MNSPSQATCAHESCHCTVANHEEYCSDFCRNAAHSTGLDTPAAATTSSRCDCGHMACAGR